MLGSIDVKELRVCTCVLDACNKVTKKWVWIITRVDKNMGWVAPPEHIRVLLKVYRK
jgi:hypothetical protein